LLLAARLSAAAATGGGASCFPQPASKPSDSARTYVIFIAMLLRIRIPATPPKLRAHWLLEAAEGLRFVWSKKILLGAVSLDLFAVLFGGATYLLPVFARDRVVFAQHVLLDHDRAAVFMFPVIMRVPEFPSVRIDVPVALPGIMSVRVVRLCAAAIFTHPTLPPDLQG
jgi:hypothetical protein